jgi:hypothetical protein
MLEIINEGVCGMDDSDDEKGYNSVELGIFTDVDVENGNKLMVLSSVVLVFFD